MAARKSPKKPAKAKAAKPKKAGAATKPKATVTAQEVNRGHLFTLRPRVNTAFRPEDFLNAKRQLKDESYESIEAAARAVAELALALANEPRKRHDFTPSQ